MFDYARFAEVHKGLIRDYRDDRHLTLMDDVKTLVDAFKECGGEPHSQDMAPWYTLIAYCYALQERLGLSIIKHMNKLAWES